MRSTCGSVGLAFKGASRGPETRTTRLAGAMNKPSHATDLRTRLRVVIFGTDTRAGRTFDIVLLVCIVASVVNLMLVSVAYVYARIGPLLQALEWAFTLAFSVEYALRIYSARKRRAYILSFYGFIDLVAILPLYLSLLFPATQYVLAIRVLRVMRIFRVLKLVRFANEANVLTVSFRHAQRKMLIIVGVLALITTLLGALMYVVEGAAHGFTSIPRSIYWAIVTMTTVGYGDIAPATALGQSIAALAVMLGYAMLAVTGGIITAELTNEIRESRQRRQCPHCERSGHEIDARYCKFCGGDLESTSHKQSDQATTHDKLD